MITDVTISRKKLEHEARAYLLKIRQVGTPSYPTSVTSDDFERVVKQLADHTERQLRKMGKLVVDKDQPRGARPRSRRSKGVNLSDGKETEEQVKLAQSQE